MSRPNFNRPLPTSAAMLQRRSRPPPPIGDRYPSPRQRAAVPPQLRAGIWVGAAVLLLVFAMSVAALAISIHNLRVNSKHARELGLRSTPGAPPRALLTDGAGEFVRTTPQKTGQSPRWDARAKRWVSDHGTLEELRDVRLGSKERPLADGDLLRWEQGRIVNARDPMLTQELGHHVDAKIVRPATGDVLLYNETAGQWRNVPLRAFLTMSGLHDVRMPAGKQRRALEDGARLEYDAKRGGWAYRAPLASAWLSFCIPIEGGGDADADKWGHLTTPLEPGKWVGVNPKSERLSIFAVDQHSSGGMRISRKNANIMTPRPPVGARPSAARTPYRIRATISTVGFPPGAWAFVVGNEASPSDNGFVVSGSADEMRSFSLETVRTAGYEQTISLAYNAQRAAGDGGAKWREPLVQCMRMSVEEL